MAKKFKHELGIEAKDVVTGFNGIITSRTEHITGCNTYGIQPKASEGKILDSGWFDEERVEKVDDGVKVKVKNHNDGAGENHPTHHKHK